MSIKLNKYKRRTFNINLPIWIETNDSEIYFNVTEVKINHAPERPMPQCSDPNKSAYYDNGDPEENEFADIDEVKQQARDKFEKIIKELNEQFEFVLDNLEQTDLHNLIPGEEYYNGF